MGLAKEIVSKEIVEMLVEGLEELYVSHIGRSNLKSREALQKIQAITGCDSLDEDIDEEACFLKIKQIMGVFKELGSDADWKSGR